MYNDARWLNHRLPFSFYQETYANQLWKYQYACQCPLVYRYACSLVYQNASSLAQWSGELVVYLEPS